MPPGAWDAIQDVSSLERAIEDVEYRENELRAEHRVSPRPLLYHKMAHAEPQPIKSPLWLLAALCQRS